MTVRSPMAVAALAALSLALTGAASGQPRIPIASDFEGTTSTPPPDEHFGRYRDSSAPDALRSVERTSSQMHLACAADRAKLCADSKTTFSADRCLEGHRRDVNEACRAALSQAMMAWSGPR